MTRRDTIIVAVLINAGLLVVLFISSLKNDTTIVGVNQEKKAEQTRPVAKKEVPIAKASSDQVDQLLAQYSKKIVKEPLKEEKRSTKETPSEEVAAIKPKIEKDSVEKSVLDKETTATLQKGKEKVQESTLRPELTKVVVKKGDVLEKIAKSYGVSVGAIMQENKLTDSRLQIGQVIYIPQATQAPSAIKAIPQLEERYYVVKNGDNLWKIALEHHLKVEDLLTLNQLSEKQAKALRPGDRLRIK